MQIQRFLLYLQLQYNCNMEKILEPFNLSLFKTEKGMDMSPKNYADENLALFLDSNDLKPLLRTGQPYIVSHKRIMLIASGSAVMRTNLVRYEFKAHDLMMLPPDNIEEIEGYTSDFATEALVVDSLPGMNDDIVAKLFPPEAIFLHLDDDDWHRVEGYLRLMSLQLHRNEPLVRSVGYLVAGMCEDIRFLWKQSQKMRTEQKMTHGETIFRQFLQLVRQYGSRERNISFYADKLHLTPNHLGAVIRRQSGETVMAWVSRATVTQAQVLLKHFGLPVNEIASRLNFDEPTAFSRYFKRQTGQTPLEYKES